MKLVFVSTGTAAQAADFKEQYHVTAPVWIDPDRRTYATLGFRRDWRAIVSPKTYLHAFRALKKGFMQGKTQGDPHQQGGVVVVRRGGGPVYGYAAAVPGDHPPTDLVMEKVREAARG